MKIRDVILTLLSYWAAFTAVFVFRSWVIDRYVLSQYEGQAYEWAIKVGDRSIYAIVIFLLLFLLFSYLPKKRLNLLPLGFALAACGASCIFKYSEAQHEGIRTLGTSLGLGAGAIGAIILVKIYGEKRKIATVSTEDIATNLSGKLNQNIKETTISPERLTTSSIDTSTAKEVDRGIISQEKLDKNDSEDHSDNANNKFISWNDNTNNIEQPLKSANKITLGNRKKILIVSATIIVLLVLYLNLFYYPHDGEWETILYSRKIGLNLKKGEGVLEIYRPDSSFGVANTKDILLFEPHKRETTAGIAGRSNRINVSGNVLILELEGIDTVLGKLDETLYFKKVR